MVAWWPPFSTDSIRTLFACIDTDEHLRVEWSCHRRLTRHRSLTTVNCQRHQQQKAQNRTRLDRRTDGQPTGRRKANNCVRRALKNCWAFVLTARFDNASTTKRSATTNSKRCNDNARGMDTQIYNIPAQAGFPGVEWADILIVSRGACRDESDTKTTEFVVTT